MAKELKKTEGVVYSTNPNFHLNNPEAESTEDTKQPKQQDLRVSLDKKQRGGKKVTLVTGFSGPQSDLEALGKLLKSRCGVGGTAKEGEIVIQGDFVEKVIAILITQGYKAKRSGG